MRVVIPSLGILLLSSLASGVQAQRNRDELVEASEETDPRARSRALAIQAQEQFAQGDAEGAVALLLEARAIYREPLLSYNLARVYDSVGDHQQALESYERFLAESPEATNRAPIELRIAALRQTIEDLDAPQPTAAPVPEPAPEDSGPGPWPWVVTATGGATLLAAAVLGGLARSTRGDAAEETEHRAAVETQDRAQRQATTANVLFAVGGTFAGVGILWAVISAVRSKRRSASSTRSVSSESTGLRVRSEFSTRGASLSVQW